MQIVESQKNSDPSKENDLSDDWLAVISEEFEKDYMINLKSFLTSELKKGKVIYPHGKNIFNALKLTSFKDVKVVIIGQDPYHGPGQAHGLSFSVQDGVRLPPSLINIYKELESDLGVKPRLSGNLENWAKQGVLLLNDVLTVEARTAGSHQNKGWETFTDKIVHQLNDLCVGLVFILWGSRAQKKCSFINTKKHHIIRSVHPSPLSSYRGFFGSKPFSRANNYLVSVGKKPINW